MGNEQDRLKEELTTARAVLVKAEKAKDQVAIDAATLEVSRLTELVNSTEVANS